MTNGEMIQKVFNCEVCEPIPEDDIIHVIFPDKNDSAIGFDWSWWIMEYKEPVTKKDLGVDCIDRDSAIKALDYDIKCFEFKSGVSKHMDDIAKLLNTIYETQVNNIKALSPVTPQEPMVIPIAEFKFDKDKLKELVDRAVLTVLPQEPTDKIFTKADLDSMAKAINYGWELRVNGVLDKIRAEIDNALSDGMIHKKTVIGIIDKYKAEIEPQEDEE